MRRHRKLAALLIVVLSVGLVGVVILGLALPDSFAGRLLRGSAGARGTVEITVFSGWSEQEQGHIRWETATETGITGFHLYRSDDGSEPYQRLTAEPIPSTAPGGGGAAYDLLDDGVLPGETYFYKLEPVDNLGGLARHGPIAVSIYPISVQPPTGPSRIFLPTLHSSP